MDTYVRAVVGHDLLEVTPEDIQLLSMRTIRGEHGSGL